MSNSSSLGSRQSAQDKVANKSAELESSTRQAADKAADAAGQGADQVNSASREAADKLRSGADEAGSKARNAADKVGDRVDSALDKAGKKVDKFASDVKRGIDDADVDKAKREARKAADKTKREVTHLLKQPETYNVIDVVVLASLAYAGYKRHEEGRLGWQEIGLTTAGLGLFAYGQTLLRDWAVRNL
ncbi:hypothetical protein PYCC9005_002902 [Savitreella phatthalungensis]